MALGRAHNAGCRHETKAIRRRRLEAGMAPSRSAEPGVDAQHAKSREAITLPVILDRSSAVTRPTDKPRRATIPTPDRLPRSRLRRGTLWLRGHPWWLGSSAAAVQAASPTVTVTRFPTGAGRGRSLPP